MPPQAAVKMFDQFWDAAAALDVPAGKYTVAELVKAIHFAGWSDCLRQVRASLEDYPNQGGDIKVMAAVEALLAQTRLEEAKLRANQWPPLGAFRTPDSLIRYIEERALENVRRIAELEREFLKKFLTRNQKKV